ncbi:MAG: hypothetical protein H7641_03870, partial [Candidatus Heimdallarchaeota archaeon]|nr:hypothetical protein [Candidatus Heimdallarchaeota archaeon]MCK4876701.1 hypothetical protein [Candidatus Heimdallarchaeota archaeon]
MSNKKTKRSKKSNVKKSKSPTALLLENSNDELKSKLKKVEKIEKEESTKEDLEAAIKDAIGKLKPLSDQVQSNKRVLKEDLESAIHDVIDNLIPVSSEDISHALIKQDLKSEIRDAKANLTEI